MSAKNNGSTSAIKSKLRYLNRAQDFLHAVSCCNAKLVRRLINYIDPSMDSNIATRDASRYGYADIVAILLKHEKVDPSAEYSAALRYAAEAGNIRTVRLLLEDGRAHPYDCASYALHAAIHNRYYMVVEALLQDGRVDIFARDYYAMALADPDQQLIDMLEDYVKQHGDVHKAKRLRTPEPLEIVQLYFQITEGST